MNPSFPTGLDRGDGVTQLPAQPAGTGGLDTFGTANPSGAVVQQYQGPSQPPQEDPASPEIERAEQGTIVHKLRMAWQDGLAYITALGRGVFLEDSSGNITRILSAKLNSVRGDQSELIITAESISFDSPPDDWQVIPIDLGIDIIKNPRYSWALSPVAGDNGTYAMKGDIPISFTSLKSSLIRLIQTYRDAPFFPSADQINGLIQNNVMSQLSSLDTDLTWVDLQVPTGNYNNGTYLGFNPNLPVSDPPRWDGFFADLPAGNYQYAVVGVPVDLTSNTDPIVIAIAATKEIISKLWRQEDTPYATAYQVTLSIYTFAPIFLNPGGYIESPVGIVPDYFMSPSQDGTDTIFDDLANLNPQDYSIDGTRGGAEKVNISWLRKSDETEYQRTWFRTTSTWIGAPIGSWDSDLYNQNDRPQNASEFNQLI